MYCDFILLYQMEWGALVGFMNMIHSFYLKHFLYREYKRAEVPAFNT